jgi:hypothetical protein
MAEPPHQAPTPGNAPPGPRQHRKPWWADAYHMRRIVFAGCELVIAIAWTLAIAVLGWVLDVSRVGDHVLFRNALEGASWWHYGLRVSALFDLLHLTVILNFIYRSVRHWNRAYREDE